VLAAIGCPRNLPSMPGMDMGMGMNSRGQVVASGSSRVQARAGARRLDSSGVWDETGEARPATDGPWRVR
jgi:hypothetical protein